ncbi:hypothetical protein GW17_00005706 [Ensete ventricosum]|nr:hypothetical protein GW17_00005706 [Ensete ventricosum]
MSILYVRTRGVWSGSTYCSFGAVGFVLLLLYEEKEPQIRCDGAMAASQHGLAELHDERLICILFERKTADPHFGSPASDQTQFRIFPVARHVDPVTFKPGVHLH